MNKDAILASGIGFGIGLLITGAILLGPTLISQLTQRQSSNGDVQSATQSVNDTPTDTTTTPTAISIDSPLAESILTKNTVEISGKAPQGSIIIVAGDVDETAVTVDTSNAFKATVSLKEGKNDVSITSIQQGTPTVQKLILFYTPTP